MSRARNDEDRDDDERYAIPGPAPSRASLLPAAERDRRGDARATRAAVAAAAAAGLAGLLLILLAPMEGLALSGPEDLVFRAGIGTVAGFLSGLLTGCAVEGPVARALRRRARREETVLQCDGARMIATRARTAALAARDTADAGGGNLLRHHADRAAAAYADALRDLSAYGEHERAADRHAAAADRMPDGPSRDTVRGARDTAQRTADGFYARAEARALSVEAVAAELVALASAAGALHAPCSADLPLDDHAADGLRHGRLAVLP